MKLINDKKFWADVDRDLEGKGRKIISLANLAFVLDDAIKDLPKKKKVGKIINNTQAQMDLGYNQCLKDCNE